MKKIILYSLSAGLLLFACTKGETSPAPGTDGQASAIQFISTVEGESFSRDGGLTRAVDNEWSAGDEIGVFSYAHGGTLNSSTVVSANKKYVTEGGNGFSAAGAGDIISMQDGDQPIDFVAYYPYTATSLSGFKYAVDLSLQADQEAIDLMWAINTTGFEYNNVAVDLAFSHQLVKLVLNVEAEMPVYYMEVDLGGVPVTGSFDLGTGDLTPGANGTIRLKTVLDGTKATVEGIVMPMSDLAGAKLTFYFNGNSSLVYELPAGTDWQAGKKYNYPVKLTNMPDDVNWGWFETPARTELPNTTFLDYGLPADEYPGVRSYSLLYDEDYMISYWVAYPMCSFYRYPTASSSYGSVWLYDDRIPQEKQPNIRNNSWPDYNGVAYDRGHQLPSADRRYSFEANKQTYYAVNQTAQQQQLNRNPWATLETNVREWMMECDTLYIVTGAHPTSELDPVIERLPDNSGKQVVLPKYFYKALAKYDIETNEYHTIAFVMDNVWTASAPTLSNFALSVAELEERTGFTFFPYLPDELKAGYDISKFVQTKWSNN